MIQHIEPSVLFKIQIWPRFSKRPAVVHFLFRSTFNRSRYITGKYKTPFDSESISQYKWTSFERHYRIFVFEITLA